MNSLLRNTVMKYELIVADNGDSNQTKYLKRVKINKHLIFGENKGITYGRNTGADKAIGEYICFVDADVVFMHGWDKQLIGL